MLAPLWLDPATFDQLRAVTPSFTPEDGATLTPAASGRPSLDPGLFTQVIARDNFSRTVSDGWGSAEFGGQYVLSGEGARLSADGFSGLLALGPGAAGSASLTRAIGRDVTVEFTLGAGTLPADSEAKVSILSRLAPDGSAYSATIDLSESGEVTVSLEAVTQAGAQTIAGPVLVSDVASGMDIRIRAEVIDTDPATIRLDVWPAGEPEPAAWQAQVSDWTAQLQRAGTIAIGWSSSSSQSDTESLLTFDDLLATSTMLATTTDEGLNP